MSSTINTDTAVEITAYLIKEFGFGEDDVQDMLSELLITLDEFCSSIDQEVANSNWKQIRRSAHAIKGAAANVGAKNISNAARKLEEMIRTDNPDLAISAQLISEIQRNFHALQAQLS